MAFDAELLTSAAALAMYDRATTHHAKLEAAAAMAHVLRTPKAKRPKVAAPETGPLTAERLAAALKRVCAVIESRTTIPVMACVRLTSAKGRLSLFASDMDINWSEAVAAEGLGDFDICIPARPLAQALRGARGEVVLRDTSEHFPGETVERRSSIWDRETQKHVETVTREPVPSIWRATLTVDGAELSFNGQDPDDLPPLAQPAGQPVTACLPLERLKRPLADVRLCISAEETRYYLNGAYMHVVVEDGAARLRFASTDGSKLMCDTGPEASDFPREMPGVILPSKPVGFLLQHMPDGEALVEVWETQVCITTNAGALSFKTIDGNFPDYARVIPRGEDRKATLQFTDAKALAGAIDRVVRQSQDRSATVTVTPDKITGVVTLSRRGMDGETVRVEAPGVNYHGDGAAFQFNGRYLRDLVEVGGPGLIALFSPSDPALFAWDDAPSRTAVLMPLRQ